MKLVVTDGATLSGGGVSLDIFSQFGEVQIYDLTAPEQLAERVGDADGILCNKTPIPAELFDRCPKLRYVGDTLAEAVLNGKQMELFEERSGDGTPTGTIVERGVAHSEGRCHGTAHIWIARANEKSGCEVLLQKRSAWKDSNPGCYDISSAGHLSAGDTYLEGALREIGEELGIHAEAEELRDLGLLEKVSHGVFYGKPFHDHEVSAVYLYTKPVEAEKLHLQESEVEAVRWMDLKECQKAVREGSIPNCIDIRELEMIEKAWFAGEKTKDEE